MRLAWIVFALAALAAKNVVAFPASIDVQAGDGGVGTPDISHDANSDLWLGPDMLSGDNHDGLTRQFSRDVEQRVQDPESYGLGPVPGFWPGHRHGREHDHEHKHEHGHGHEDGHDEEDDHGSAPHHGEHHPHKIGKCKQRDYTPRTREYDWTITYGYSAPDGFLKKRILVNGQSPGPMIEANEGDDIVVRVKNYLDQGTSIHWHGMFQNSTPFMDGIAGFSQCPIPAGGELTYRFKIEGQYGSYWWHSHSKMQYTDGLYGGLIVHSKNDPYQKCRDYDDERVFLFADNYHDFADDIVEQLLSAQGYNGTAAAPSPQSGLINGAGQFNCAALARAKGSQPGLGKQTRCTPLAAPTMSIEPKKKYRFRFINTGSHAQHIISIDDHEMHVIAADGTPVKPHKVHRIPIHNGQRHDVLVQTNVGRDGDSFLLRSAMMTLCFAFKDPLLDPVANLTLQYRDPLSHVKPRAPIPHDWKDALGSQCQDLNDTDLIPAVDTSVPPNHNARTLGIFNSQFGNLVLSNGTTLGRFFIDNVTHTNYVNRPYLELELAVVGEQDQAELVERGVGGRGEHHLVGAVLDRLLGLGGAHALGVYAGDVDAVRLLQARLAERPHRALVAGRQPHLHLGPAEVAERLQMVLGGERAGHRERVLVHRGSGGQHLQAARGGESAQRGDGGGDVGGRDGPGVRPVRLRIEEFGERRRVLRNDVDLALLQGRLI